MAFPVGWSNYKVITIDHTLVGSTLTDFAKLVKKASDADILAHALANGNDIRFSNDSGSPTEYPFGHIGTFSAGNLLERVKVPSISAVVDTPIRVWYGNAGASNGQNKSGVLDSNTVGYWPLEEDPSGSAPQSKDWSSNANDGTSTGSMGSGTLVTGQVGNGVNFAHGATDDRIDALDNGSQLGGIKHITLRCLVKPENNFGDAAQFIQIAKVGGFFSSTLLGRNGAGQFNADVELADSTHTPVSDSSTFSNGTWYHVAMTYDGTTLTLYKNGSSVGTASPSGANLIASAGTVYFGNRAGQDREASAVIDEIFIDKTDRSAAWIAYDYTDQFSNSSTFTLGSEQSAASSKSLGLTLMGVG